MKIVYPTIKNLLGGGSRQGVTGEIIKDSQQLLGDGVQESLKEAGISGNWF